LVDSADVVAIGAGLSGLMAAVQAAEHQYQWLFWNKRAARSSAIPP
jgi:succinate dehydrogenase/fumarate reductase flavoprotein subunit